MGQPLTGQHADPDFPVIYDITTPITRGLVALMNDTLTASATDLFTLEATSDPSLTPQAEEAIMGQLQEQQMAMMSLGMSGSMTETQESAKMLIQAAMVAGAEQAQSAADSLKHTIKDMLQENGFDAAVRAGIHDLVHSLAMVIKAPSPRLKKVKRWDGGRLMFVDELVRGVERIDPVNLYPAPNAVCSQTADYLVEVRTSSPNELAALAASEGYDALEIARVLDMHPEGYKAVNDDGTVMWLKEPDQNTDVVTENVKPFNYDVLIMYGRVRGALLKDFGIEGVEDHLHYEAEIMAVDTCVIRATLNPDPAGKRPFYHTSYDPVQGSFWGRCPVSHVIPLQRAATSAFVALMGDLAMSGIHIELNTAHLHEDDRLTADAVRPRVVRQVKKDATLAGKRAYDIFPVTAQTAAFREELRHLEEKAYEVVGLQRFAVGQTTGAGTIGRTAGGLASLLNQASKGTKQVLRNIENFVVEPVVQHFVDYELQWGEVSAELHGDVNVQAKGLTEVAENAGQADDLSWALQSISAIADKVDPMTGQPFIPAAAFPRLVYQMFKAKGIPTHGVFPDNFESTSALQGQSAGGLPGADVPGLDGRSQTSINSINQSNDLMGVGAGA